MDNYVVTHCHTELSSGTTNIDSVTKFKDYIIRAKECGMKAIAFTEHGNIYSWVKKKQLCEEYGLKYIHGVEAYITKDISVKVRDNYHCCLYALNEAGKNELNKLISISNKDDHKYYTPRISFDEFTNISNNIAITTACIGGILGSDDEELKERYIEFLVANKERCFLEIGHHNTDKQKEYNKYMLDLHSKYGLRVIAGTDTHALNKRHIKGRTILQKAKNIFFDNERGWDLSFKTFEDLVAAFEDQGVLPYHIYMDAINNTNVLADMVEEFTLDYSYKYPCLWDDSAKVFNNKIKQGIKHRGVDKYSNYKEYIDRIEYELKAYEHNGAIDFMLLMEDIISWCTENGIYVGYGRGSCNGSVIAWLLGITEMDSIKHGLNFDRFMNTERVSLSDIDTDFPPSRRDDVKDYIFSKTGLYCADIITFNTVALKGAIRDVGRALEMPLEEVDIIAKSVDSDEEKLRKKYPELFEYVDIINGTVVSVGSHPCGTVVSPHDVEETIGTFTSSTSKYPISQINMKEIDGLNYVKLDLLGLDSIELINDTCKLANIERLTPDNVDDEDINVWNSIRDNTTQIFQWEGTTGNSYIKRLLSDDTIKSFETINPNVKRMDLLSIGNSAIRPAGASYRDELGSGRFRDSGSSVLNEFLSNTYSFLVYQEQIIQFLHKYCGFTMGEADIVRRGFAKKTGTEKYIPIIKNGGYMDEKNKNHYIKGFVQTMYEQYNMSNEEAENTIVAFIQVIEDASSYLFSLNHSQPYSYTGYIAGYLRYYYPLEFLTTSFNINKENSEKTNKLTEYALERGIDVKSPIFRKSKGEYFFDKETNSIYKGIGSIKYMNNAVGDELYELKDNKYNSFVELLKDIKSTSCNSRQLDILIKIGFFNEFGSIKKLLEVVEIFNTYYSKKTISKDKIALLGLDHINLNKYATDRSEKTGKEQKTWKLLDVVGLINELSLSISDEEYDITQLLQWQNEILGYIGYTNSKLDKRYAFVQKIDGIKGTRKVNLYCLNNGKTSDFKVNSRLFSSKPFKEGDIIYTASCSKKYKAIPIEKDENNKVTKWGKDMNTIEWWLDDYNNKLN